MSPPSHTELFAGQETVKKKKEKKEEDEKARHKKGKKGQRNVKRRSS